VSCDILNAGLKPCATGEEVIDQAFGDHRPKFICGARL